MSAGPELDLERAVGDLSFGVRLRMALDVLERAAEAGLNVSARSAASGMRLRRIQVDADGVSSVPGGGDTSGVVALVWEILAGRVLPSTGFEGLDDAPGPVADAMDAAANAHGPVQAVFEALDAAARGHVDTNDDVRRALDRLLEEGGPTLEAPSGNPEPDKPLQAKAAQAPVAKVEPPKPPEPKPPEPPKPEPTIAKADPAPTVAKVEPPKPEPAPTVAKVEPPKPEPAPTVAKLEPPKPEPAPTVAKPDPKSPESVKREAPKPEPTPAPTVAKPAPTVAKPEPKAPKPEALKPIAPAKAEPPAGVSPRPQSSPKVEAPKPAEPAKPDAPPAKPEAAKLLEPKLLGPKPRAEAPTLVEPHARATASAEPSPEPPPISLRQVKAAPEASPTSPAAPPKRGPLPSSPSVGRAPPKLPPRRISVTNEGQPSGNAEGGLAKPLQGPSTGHAEAGFPRPRPPLATQPMYVSRPNELPTGASTPEATAAIEASPKPSGGARASSPGLPPIATGETAATTAGVPGIEPSAAFAPSVAPEEIAKPAEPPVEASASGPGLDSITPVTGYRAAATGLPLDTFDAHTGDGVESNRETIRLKLPFDEDGRGFYTPNPTHAANSANVAPATLQAITEASIEVSPESDDDRAPPTPPLQVSRPADPPPWAMTPGTRPAGELAKDTRQTLLGLGRRGAAQPGTAALPPRGAPPDLPPPPGQTPTPPPAGLAAPPEPSAPPLAPMPLVTPKPSLARGRGRAPLAPPNAPPPAPPVAAAPIAPPQPATPLVATPQPGAPPSVPSATPPPASVKPLPAATRRQIRAETVRAVYTPPALAEQKRGRLRVEIIVGFLVAVAVAVLVILLAGGDPPESTGSAPTHDTKPH